MAYKILAVDDDEHMHVIVSSLLGEEFELLHAKSGQEAIDMLSHQHVNLILSDIHMPGITGLEFLESIMADAEKRQIPVLIMTNLPTVEKEQSALNLGAADFIDKVRFANDKKGVQDLVRMKLVSNIVIPEVDEDLAAKKQALASMMMRTAIKNDFKQTSAVLCEGLLEEFKADYVAYWSLSGESPELISAKEKQGDADATIGDFKNEQGFKAIKKSKQPYLTNHIFNEHVGFMQSFSEEKNLAAEIAVPLFDVNERQLLMNNMEMPQEANITGILFIKRNKLFSTEEYEVISRLVMQSGSILWRLYSQA